MPPHAPEGAMRVSAGVVLLIVIGSAFLTGIGLSSMTVVFPELAKAFPDTSPATLSWVANLFTIVGAATLVPAGALADKTGRKRMVLIGVALFGLGSLIGALAPDPAWLMVARSVQALGASAYTPASAALLIAAFPPEKLATAIGVWAVTGGVTSAVGPPVAGLLIRWQDWRWTFWFTVPASMLIVALGIRYLQESVVDRTKKVPDPFGAVIVMVGISGVVLALVQGRTWGWLDQRTLVSAVAGLLVLVWFVWRCSRHPNPILELDLFRIDLLWKANLGMFVVSIAFFTIYWGLIQYAFNEWGWDAFKVGLTSAPMSLMAGVLGIVVGRLARTRGHRVFILPGTVCFGGSLLFLYLTIGEEPAVVPFVIGSALLGSSSGSVFPSFIAASMHDVPRERHAVGTGINFMIQRVGTTIGVALAIVFLVGPDGSEGQAGLQRALVFAAVGLPFAFLCGTTIDTRPRPQPQLRTTESP
jgi:MFS family permease